MTLSLEAAQAGGARALRDGGIETASLDARALLRLATGLSLESLIVHGRDPLDPASGKRFDEFVARRLAGEPVSRIRGTREFYGRDFRIDSHTLDPRPDTETLIATVLDIARTEGWGKRPLRLLDLGTGSGCILATLLAEIPSAHGLGADISEGALRLAKFNAESVGVGERCQFVASNWFDAVAGRFDLIVSNPPYIAREEIGTLAREVTEHDPRAALDGGPDGLEAYREIAAQARLFLVPSGRLVVEIGCTQADAVADIFRAAGLTVQDGDIVADLAGRSRCVRAMAPEQGDAAGGG